MEINKKKFFNIKIIIIFFLVLALFFYVTINKFQKDKDLLLAQEPISINLLTSVHPDLPWNFRPVESIILVKPGEVKTVEYIVENLENKETTGVATFAYFPNELGNYISKINCFCYDARTLKPKQKDKYILVLLIDPEVTKDTKTKNVKEATIQFTFFDYKKYKKQES
tara:strand:- start:271 stop:774 length:504 start_codon:yes stop_codon:yes gene_type:complete